MMTGQVENQARAMTTGQVVTAAGRKNRPSITQSSH
jgi:hypothetical protein